MAEEEDGEQTNTTNRATGNERSMNKEVQFILRKEMEKDEQEESQ